MNQKLLGAVRSVGYLVLFAVLTAIIGAIPDALTQLPYIGGYITPAFSLALTSYLAAKEHQYADTVGYNLPAGSTKVSSTMGHA